MRGQGQDDVRLRGLGLVAGEEAPQEGNAGEAGHAGEARSFGIADQAGQDVGLAVVEADDAGEGPAVEGGQALVAGRPYRGDVELQAQGDVAVVVDPGRDIDVHAHVLV